MRPLVVTTFLTFTGSPKLPAARRRTPPGTSPPAAGWSRTPTRPSGSRWTPGSSAPRTSCSGRRTYGILAAHWLHVDVTAHRRVGEVVTGPYALEDTATS